MTPAPTLQEQIEAVELAAKWADPMAQFHKLRAAAQTLRDVQSGKLGLKWNRITAACHRGVHKDCTNPQCDCDCHQ